MCVSCICYVGVALWMGCECVRYDVCEAYKVKNCPLRVCVHQGNKCADVWVCVCVQCCKYEVANLCCKPHNDDASITQIHNLRRGLPTPALGVELSRTCRDKNFGPHIF